MFSKSMSTINSTLYDLEEPSVENIQRSLTKYYKIKGNIINTTQDTVFLCFRSRDGKYKAVAKLNPKNRFYFQEIDYQNKYIVAFEAINRFGNRCDINGLLRFYTHIELTEKPTSILITNHFHSLQQRAMLVVVDAMLDTRSSIDISPLPIILQKQLIKIFEAKLDFARLMKDEILHSSGRCKVCQRCSVWTIASASRSTDNKEYAELLLPDERQRQYPGRFSILKKNFI